MCPKQARNNPILIIMLFLRFSVIPTLDEDALMETNITEWMTISPYHGMDITYFTW